MSALYIATSLRLKSLITRTMVIPLESFSADEEDALWWRSSRYPVSAER